MEGSFILMKIGSNTFKISSGVIRVSYLVGLQSLQHGWRIIQAQPNYLVVAKRPAKI